MSAAPWLHCSVEGAAILLSLRSSERTADGTLALDLKRPRLALRQALQTTRAPTVGLGGGAEGRGKGALDGPRGPQVTCLETR